MKAMARLPEDRYASAEALRDEISNFLGGYSTLAEKPGFFREARLFLRRNRVAATITFLAIVALSVVSVLFIQGINHQQERAAQFASEAESVTTLYLDELERSEQERKVLASALASSAGDLKKLGIFVRPVETVREARKLIDSAFALNSESATAQMQSFSLECITLNFKAALKNPLKPQSELVDYLLFAKAFPDFNFTEKRRPTVEQLSGFLLKAREINPNRKALMERMVAYDFAARTDKEGYAPVVEALLEYVNEKKGDLHLEHQLDESSLVVRAGNNFRFVIWDKWGSNDCLLRFLAIRSLKPVVDDRFYLGDLQSLQIETLDLSDCEEVVINHPVNLPLLRTLYIRPGQVDAQTLHKSILSNDRFAIIIKENQK
jgi:hypothetical protein